MSEPTTHATFTAPPISQLAPLFPGYEIEVLIATGGMGAVYRAIQKSLDRTVAIKILPREFSKDKAFCEGFEAEAKAMARLNHPNLIGVYDFGEVDGMLFIIMEYVPGQSLFDSAHGIAIDSGEVIRLVTGICNGLAHAHDNGILHRDIKPSNILLDLNAEPKIGDFGLARPVDRQVQEGEEIFGTPHYTAPEVVNAPQTVNQRADIFSVGVMLHELLTGKLPAEDKRPASAIIRCDPRFDAIVRKATHPQPELRYASAAEISRELQVIAASAGPRVLRTAATAAAPRPPHLAPKPSLAPPAKSSGSTGILVLVMVMVIGFVAYQQLSGPAKPAPAPPTAAKPEPPPSKPTPAPLPVPVPHSPHNPDSISGNHSGENSQVESVHPTPEDEPEDMQTTQSGQPDSKDHNEAEPAAPIFDVPGFLLRARTIMKERANPLIATRDKSFADTLKSFERDVNRIIRRIDSRTIRNNFDTDFENFLEDCAEDGNRIPKKVPPPLNTLVGMKSVHEEALEQQEAADSLLFDSLRQLSDTYILGIEKQIERLQPTNDPAAIKLLQEEIENSRTKDTYFAHLMLGIDPEEEPGTVNAAGALRKIQPED